MALNSIVFTENVVRSFRRYRSQDKNQAAALDFSSCSLMTALCPVSSDFRPPTSVVAVLCPLSSDFPSFHYSFLSDFNDLNDFYDLNNFSGSSASLIF